MTELEQKLLDALKNTTQALAWQCFGECIGFSEALLSPDLAVKEARAAIAEAEAKSAKPVSDADGWIPWAGGKCPVAFETKVDVRHRDGNEYQGFAGYSIARFWDDVGDPRDIIAYRIVKEPT